MPKNYYRRVENEHTKDTQGLQSQMFDILSGCQKGISMGAVLDILGALNVAVFVGIGAQIKVFNNTITTSFVKLGAATVTAPTGPANGIPIPPNSYVFICSGEDTYIRSNIATTFGYKAKDDTTLRVEKTE